MGERQKAGWALPAICICLTFFGCAPVHQSSRVRAIVVGGVRLVPVSRIALGTPTTAHEQCVATARALGYPVPCPQLLPEDSESTPIGGGPCAGLHVGELIHPGCDGAARFAFASIDWPTNARVGHLVYLASPQRMSAHALIYVSLKPSSSDTLTPAGSVSLGTIRALLFKVPNGSDSAFGGHLVAVWSVGGHSYALGFHGTDEIARKLDLAVVASVELVR